MNGSRTKSILALLTTLLACSTGVAKDSGSEWRSIQASREKEIRKHVASNPQGFANFINGSIGQGPVPLLMLSILPEIMPALWGEPGENMQQVGLTKNPYFSNHGLPLGIGAESVSLEQIIGAAGKNERLKMAGFNCVACHAGKVETRPGKFKTLLGAPNTRINNVLLLFARTVTHPDFKADTILDHLKAKPLGSIYGYSRRDRRLETQERKVFEKSGIAEAVVASMRARGEGILGGFEKFVRPRTYSAPGQTSPDPYALKRGSMDAFLPLHLAFVSLFATNPAALDAALPKHTSETDSPSIWRQRDRGVVGHWDGNHINTFHRNVGAAAAGLNNPVNLSGVQKVTEFIQDLPSSVYPFEVDMKMAKRGEALYNQNCVSCHSAQNRVYSIADLGTSANRLNSITPTAAGFLGQVHLTLCNDLKLCAKSDGTPHVATDISQKTDGYVAGPLDGVWARAPYLHNGSVPTLYALLTGDRPKQFYRGSVQYDQRLVGFAWEQPSADAVLFNTELSGNSNAGHNGVAFLGFDSNREPQKIWDLLEYLKTL